MFGALWLFLMSHTCHQSTLVKQIHTQLPESIGAQSQHVGLLGKVPLLTETKQTVTGQQPC